MAIINGKYYPDGNASSAINLLMEQNAALVAALKGLYEHTKNNHNICGLNEQARALLADKG